VENNLESQLIEDSIFKVGSVFSVKGRAIEIAVDKQKNSSSLIYKGNILKNVAVGSFIKITKGFIRIIAIVEGEYIKENLLERDKIYQNRSKLVDRILSVSLLGFFDGDVFKRGIKELPLVGNECYILSKEEFNETHYFIKEEGGIKDEPIKVGTLSLEKGQAIFLGVNSLFASHIGIFGNTGSGKSYTLAKLYRLLFLKYSGNRLFNNKARFLFFDFNGEYSLGSSIVANKRVYSLTTKNDRGDKLPINESDLLDVEILSILGDATEKTQKPFLNRVIKYYKYVMANDDPVEYFKNILRKRVKEILSMSDKNRAFLLLDYISEILPDKFDVSGMIIDLMDDLEWHNTASEFKFRSGTEDFLAQKPDKIPNAIIYQHIDTFVFAANLLSKIIDFMYLQLIQDVLSNRAQNEHVAPVINKLFSRKNDIEKLLSCDQTVTAFWSEDNIAVINLSDVKIEMKKVIPLILSKKLYSEHKEHHRRDEKESLNIIVDEAHNILSSQSFRETENWRDYRLETFEEIIKEGRKFGVFLTVSSQRPSDISPTIISQLHNFFLHRLINDEDLKAVERNISYLDKASAEYISILPTGSCVLAGLASNMPVIIDIDPIEEREFEPHNETINLVKNWEDDDPFN